MEARQTAAAGVRVSALGVSELKAARSGAATRRAAALLATTQMRWLVRSEAAGVAVLAEGGGCGRTELARATVHGKPRVLQR
jgi:hypothetical protein